MICLLKEQLVVLGGVILKLEEFEGAVSEKDGGSGKGGHCFFFHRKSILSCFGPQHSKKWWWFFFFFFLGGGGGVGCHCFLHERDNAE